MLKTFLSGASAGKEIVLNFEGKNSLHIEMKQIEVVAAIICREGKYFATQRGYGEFKDYWEFPGGKIEAGESREELGSVDWLPADVEVVKKLVGEKKDKMIDEDLSH